MSLWTWFDYWVGRFASLGGAMQRKFAALIGILLMLGALVVPAALASVPKVMTIEEFGATW
jgi:hypothetical protein